MLPVSWIAQQARLIICFYNNFHVRINRRTVQQPLETIEIDFLRRRISEVLQIITQPLNAFACRF